MLNCTVRSIAVLQCGTKRKLHKNVYNLQYVNYVNL